MPDRSQLVVDAYCRAVAALLEQHAQEILAKARGNLERMRLQCHPALVSEWKRVLAQPVDRIAVVLTGSPGAALRRNHPFAGVLSETARQRILRGLKREARGA